MSPGKMEIMVWSSKPRGENCAGLWWLTPLSLCHQELTFRPILTSGEQSQSRAVEDGTDMKYTQQLLIIAICTFLILLGGVSFYLNHKLDEQGLVLLDNNTGYPVAIVDYRTYPFQTFHPGEFDYQEKVCDWNYEPKKWGHKIVMWPPLNSRQIELAEQAVILCNPLQ